MKIKVEFKLTPLETKTYIIFFIHEVINRDTHITKNHFNEYKNKKNEFKRWLYGTIADKNFTASTGFHWYPKISKIVAKKLMEKWFHDDWLKDK